MTGGTLFETGILRVTTGLAIVAGLVLTAMAIVTVISINGRSLIWAGLAPVPGDFELVEIGCAVAVFGFLPYCHLYRGH
ncbi:MAG: TRAP transporter small permease, partial [Silicimonas sp.]|nr:TRAP transporter small permease [Silicimonas sp.]